MDQRKNLLITNRIMVYGMVQGVGFRPLVYHIAEKYGIMGTVRNLGGAVEIIAQASEQRLNEFLAELQGTAEGGHEILRISVEPYKPQEKNTTRKPGDLSFAGSEEIRAVSFQEFTITESNSSKALRILPPDLPVCSECERELYDTKDRRYGNPFISCVACGPRYTVMEELPYDRETTTMVDYPMCEQCLDEYTSPKSRRHHAQTISCHECGPYLIFRAHGNQKENALELLREQALLRAVELLRSGGILAVKGIGGYHFVCSPFQEESVRRLRLLKGREEKPFAVMFANMDQIMEYCEVSKEEKKLLLSRPRPIVLLASRKELAPSVNRGSIFTGTFLPYTPLQLMLTKECGPLVMTSGNISGQPIIREDSVMLNLETTYLDGVLYNTRRIVRSVDDSVAKIVDHDSMMIRRSRGYVPYPIWIDAEAEDQAEQPMIFAAGGDLKAAFCLYRSGAAFVSQHFGDLEETEVCNEYEQSVMDLTHLLAITPSLAVCDLHPNYYSGRFAMGLGLPVLKVQHHHAHIASVMAEHSLKGCIIGVAFDGTGYGTDGNIWGGEFLVCEGADYQRAAHLNYIPILGGDQSMKDANKTATCYLSHLGLEEYIRDERVELIKAALKQNINCIQTSSMGRLFDAVASILSIGQYNRYEGECAVLLEQEAILAESTHISASQLSIAISEKNEIIDIDVKPMLKQLCRLRDTVGVPALALGFHYAIADMIVRVCELLRVRCGSSQVALSGGVFVNSILTEKAAEKLREHGFNVYKNREVPSGDGGISLGQTYLGQRAMMIDNRKV